MLLRIESAVAALAVVHLVAADWKDDLKNSIKNQVNSQVQASINQVVPGIVSQSAANVINQQFQPFTTAQPAANPAPAAPAAPVATVQNVQPVANNPAPAANPVINNQAMATQGTRPNAAPVANAGSGGASANAGSANANAGAAGAGSNAQNQEQAANSAAGSTPTNNGDVVENFVVVDGKTINVNDLKITTLADGSVATIAGVSTIGVSRPSTLKITTALTDAQGRTITGSIMTLNGTKPVGVKTLSVGDTDLTGNNTAPATGGLSKGATVGLGVGLGLFAVSAIGAFFLFRRWSQRKKQKHSRAPSITISGPLEAKQSSETGSTHDAKVLHAKEMDGVSKVSADPSNPASSVRSPVSPFTPGTATTASSTHSPVPPVPNIYEMMGSEPVEMPTGRPAGAEMPAETRPQEMNSAEEANRTNRPFSYAQTPVDAFVSEKNPNREAMVDVSLKDNRT